MSDEQPPSNVVDFPSHDKRGRFAPGNNERAKVQQRRQKGAATWLHQHTDGGKDIVKKALAIAMEDGHRDQLKALQWCFTVWAGKLKDTVEVTGADGKPVNPFASWTPEQLLAVAKAKKAEGA
jgi:hypothetical protein